MDLLPFKTNPYAGVLPEPAHLPKTAKRFRELMQNSIGYWQQQGFKLVWLEIPVSRANLVAVATKMGFVFHHATQRYLMLTYKLVPDASMLAYASHYVGVGGVVINERQELLVVRENMRGDNPTPYKLPGGFLEPNEHIADAVVREVQEETGVNAKFESLVCVRHWHANRFGKSDFYFVCRLLPLSLEITPQAEEIAECRWMPLVDYLSRSDVHAFNKGIVSVALKGQGWQSGWFEGYDARPSEREIFMP